MRIWISGGGTAGHVYPALTAIDALMAEPTEAVWFGRAGGVEERIVRQHGLEYRALEAAPVLGAGAAALLRNLLRLARGTARAWRAIGREQPEVVFVTGGYVSVPLAVAAWLRRRPLAVFLPDARPGLAVRLLARLADRVLASCDAARRQLPRGKTIVTGYPVRPGIRQADRHTSRQELRVADDRTLLLAYGGSQGARRINEAVMDAAPRLVGSVALLHATGQRDFEIVCERRARLGQEVAHDWQIAPFLHDDEMARALAAADLVVCRAGAATLGELPARGLPALVVPLPIAGGHQWDNARLLVDAGAAIAIADSELDGTRLVEAVESLVHDRPRLLAMADRCRGLDRPDAPEAIAAQLRRLASGDEVTDD